MDEPFAALDAMTKAKLQDELLRLRKETNISIVFITHDIEEAIYLGDEVYVMKGPPGEISESFTILLGSARDQLRTRASPQLFTNIAKSFMQLYRQINAA
jgi:NitT/TauT family transport system ATP-binding protein